MKSSKIYKEERAVVLEEMNSIVDLAKVEERELTSDEATKFDSLNEKAEYLEKQAKRAANFESMVLANVKSEEPVAPKEMREYSFQDAIKQAYTGKLEGLVKEMDQEARNSGQIYTGIAIPYSVLESRDMLTANANAVAPQSFVDQLIASSVTIGAGADFVSGLGANAKYPIVSNISATFGAEVGAEATAAGDLANIELSPQRCISVVEMSAALLAQNAGIEAAVRRNIAAACMSTLENNLFAQANASNGPASLVAALTDTGGAIDGAGIIELESDVLDANVNPALARFAYISDAKGIGKAKQAVQATGATGLYDNATKTLNSYATYSTSNMSSTVAGNSSVVFGDWSNLKIAQFGGMDILFDPYTAAGRGAGRLVANLLLDAKWAQLGSFAMLDAAH